MAELVDFIPVCPEVEIGMGVPRTPINLVKTGLGIRVLYSNQEERGDYTAQLQEFACEVVGTSSRNSQLS